MEEVKTRKKLIEVALPLEAINVASAREKSIRHGHPSTLHLWWARRPLAAARAVLFAQMVDDPSSRPELFPREEDQSRERQRLFRIIEELVKWENTTNETVLEAARQEIRQSWRRTCEDNRDHPRAAGLFNPDKLPAFHDPFAGGGSIPLEAQRLGLEAYASDLNPVAVLINKAMIEIPPKFAGRPPVNPESRQGKGSTDAVWKGATGLAEDVRYYGKWMRDEAEKRIGHLYPKVRVTEEMVQERPDLKQYEGRELTVIAWLWARTVKSPNPAFANADVPLASTFMLSTKKGKEAYVQPVIEDGSYRFTVKAGTPPETAKNGTKLARGANFKCVMSGTPLSGDYIKAEGQAGHMKARMMAIVCEGDRGRVYLGPTVEHEDTAIQEEPEWLPALTISGSTQYLGIKPYGLVNFDQLFTARQLSALTTLSDLVSESKDHIRTEAVVAGMLDDVTPLRDGGVGATAYAEAVGVYLALAVDKGANYWSTICTWHQSRYGVVSTFGRQAIPMVWDFAEANPLSDSSGNVLLGIEQAAKMLHNLGTGVSGTAMQADAISQTGSVGKIVSTDPPYYDNVPYADLSDFFYVWLRRSLQRTYPELFATIAVPKSEELVAFAYRHGGKAGAEAFFLDGMTRAMVRLADQTHSAWPVTIYYAFKQSEASNAGETSRTGWETFLDAVVRAGFSVNGTWPVRTEYTGNLKVGRNGLASSIVLVCRPHPTDAPLVTRREFVDALKSELPDALRQMQQGNIAPVDLAQASIGPGMAIFTRYSRVLDASGEGVSVREALSLINQTLDEVLAEQEGDLDSDSRWALAWFEQSGFDEGDYGVAETLSKAKNTSVSGMVDAGIARSGAGKVRLLRPEELPPTWDPEQDNRGSVWETTHHLVRVHGQQGESAAGELLAKLGPHAESARDLAYRLYRICDQKNRSQEALAYNALVRSWGEISGLAARMEGRETQQTLFE